MTIILIGRNDADTLGTGWHPAQEGPAGVPCRWMSPRALVRLPMPHPGAELLGLSVTVSAPSLIQGKAPGLSLYVNEEFQGHCANLGVEGGWNVVQIPFSSAQKSDRPSVAENGTFPVTLCVEYVEADTTIPLAFIPHEVMGNGDLRELGVLVSSIRPMLN